MNLSFFRSTGRIWLRSVPPEAALGFYFAPVRVWLNRAIKLLNGNAAAASIFVGVIALSLRVLLTPLLPLPKPAVHDEFSYLLAADTFSHGRLTNPTHPMWIHFETFHELSHPTYASMYPPGQGLVLALGQIFNVPWSSVWMSMAVLCGLITWALWGWLDPPWAIAGGFLAALQLTGSYWTESYWGGTVAAIGGALVLGALARLLNRASPGQALAFGLGLAILANTRPYEGLVLGALSAVFLLVRLIPLMRRGSQNSAQLVHSIGLPLAFVLLPVFIWMGYYNYRVTGDPLLMPYSLVDKQYGSWSPFLWSNHPRPEPKFDHEIFRSFFVKFEKPRNQFMHQHFLLGHLGNLIELYRFFLGLPLLLVILISSKHLMRNSRLRVPLLLLVLFYLGLSVEANVFPHYFAPATVLVFLVAAAVIKMFRLDSRRERCAGRRPAPYFAASPYSMLSASWIPCLAFVSGTTCESSLRERDRVSTFLLKQPGQHLVLVRYGSHHAVENEWVYNDANIDQSRIVWSHAMPGDKDDELLRYYPARRVWVLDEDEEYVTNRKEDVGFVRLSEEKKREK